MYRNARLEGRSRYILVDDLNKEEAFEVYEEFGFKNKELVWEYIGGKLGDMVRLYERKKQGYNEGESLEEMLMDETGRLKNLLKDIKYVPIIVRVRGKEIQVKEEDVRKGLKIFLEKEEVIEDEIERPVLLGCIEENILFYNPLTGVVRPQSRLLWRAIREVMSNEGI